MRSIAAGDRDAFRSVYEATSASILRAILRIVGDQGEAEDLLQEVYVLVWLKSSLYDCSRGRPMTWLFTVARRRTIDRVRQRINERMMPLENAELIVDPAPAADMLVDMSNDAKRVELVLATLQPRAAALVRHVYLDGMTYEAAASRADIPLSTAKSLVRRGLLQMRTTLNRDAQPA